MTDHNANMNVTPFLDILLVLLIMFMVIFPMSRRVLEAQLPDDAARTSVSDTVPIVLEVGPRAQFMLNRQPVAALALRARLVAVYSARPDKRLLVRGAPDATYQEVVDAMDVARGAGVTVLGIDRRRAHP